jgi:hypothetical protein
MEGAVMKALPWIGLAAVIALVLGFAEPRGADCDSAGNIRFICGQVGPEDLAVVPGGEWVISSGNVANGGIRLIRVRDKTTTVLFPTTPSKERPDRKTYGTCPGPIDPAEKENFRAHGMYLRAGKNAVHTLYVVHHGSRESIEVFEFDAHAQPPSLTWVGCAVAPDPIGLNSVVGLPDGGFITTNFLARGADPGGFKRIMAGEINGELWEWHPSSAWQKVPGTEAAGPNGLEISKDGKTLYVASWGSQSFIRVSRGQTPVKKDAVPLGFRVDNLRSAPDGSILATGQGGTAPAQTSHVARIDPNTLKVKELIRYPYSDLFRGSTSAIQIGKEIWVSSHGERIAVFPLAGYQPSH